MDPGVGHQVGLELGQVHVEGSVKPQRSSDGRNNLPNNPIKVGVGWTLDIEISPADVVDCLVVNLITITIGIRYKLLVGHKLYHEGAVGVLQGGVGCQNRVVRLDNSSGHLRSRVDGKLQLRFLSIVNRKSLHQQC